MNLKRITRKSKIKDDFKVTPSSFLIKRLVGSLDSSREIIESYFLSCPQEDAYIEELEDMIVYFKNYEYK